MRCLAINVLTCFSSRLFMLCHASSRANAFSVRLWPATRCIPHRYFHVELKTSFSGCQPRVFTHVQFPFSPPKWKSSFEPLISGAANGTFKIAQVWLSYIAFSCSLYYQCFCVQYATKYYDYS